MDKHNGTYVRLETDPTFWKVDGGKRLKVNSQAEMLGYGLRKVVVITPAELDAIPEAGNEAAEVKKGK